jgi:hypothetical protein
MVALLAVMAVGFLRANAPLNLPWLAAGLVLAGGLKYEIAYLVTLPCAVCVPGSCTTVKGLIKELLREHYGRIVHQERAWHEQDVWKVLTHVLVEALTIDPEAVTPDAHLVYDLGLS